MYTVGTWLIVIGLLIGTWQYSGIHGKEISVGKVTALEIYNSTSRSRGGPVYRIVADFPDATGATRTYRANFGLQDTGYEVGDRILIYFDRSTPENCGVLSFGYRFGVAWGFIVFGLTLLLLASGWDYGNRLLETLLPTTAATSRDVDDRTGIR
jgi:hypothetical protein